MGKTRDSFYHITEDKGFVVGVSKGKRPSLVRVGREIEDTSIRTDSGEGRIAPR